MDTLGHLSDGVAGVYGCHGTGGNQEWSLTKGGHLKHSELCLALEEPASGARIKLRLCDESVLQVGGRVRRLARRD